MFNLIFVIIIPQAKKYRRALMNNTLKMRQGLEKDCTELAFIFDMAGRRLPSAVWMEQTSQGQSSFEVGREQIRTRSDRPFHYKNWTVAESNNRLVGGFFGFLLEDPYPNIDYSEIPECIHPLVDLQKCASGSWLLQAISVLPEARNKGFSKKLLEEAENIVKKIGTSQITLQVQEDNKVAVHTYKKSGYVELDRKPFVSFLGSDDSGDYLLMGKNL